MRVCRTIIFTMVKQIYLFANYVPILYFILVGAISCISMSYRNVIELITMPLVMLSYHISTYDQQNPFTYRLWTTSIYGTYMIVSSCIYFHEYFIDYIIVINLVATVIYFIVHWFDWSIHFMIYMNILLFILPASTFTSIAFYVFVNVVINVLQLSCTTRKSHREHKLVVIKNTLRLSHILRLHPYFAWLSICHIAIEYKRRFVETQASMEEITSILKDSSTEIINELKNK